MFRRTLILLMLGAMLLFSMVAAVPLLANSAPPRWYGDKAGVPLPGSSSQVHVRKETLRFDVKGDDGAYGKARVSARYEMENAGPALTDFPVLFVIEDAGGSERNLKVTWKGAAVEAQPLETNALSQQEQAEVSSAWGALRTVMDPVTGEKQTMQDYFGQHELHFVQFALDLPAGLTATLEVSFDQTAAADRTARIHPLYHYQYLILPAKSWASFGPLEVAVRAPGPEKAFFASNLPMTYDGAEYKASFPGLPPEDLAFSFMSKRGLVGSMVTTGPYYLFAFGLLLIIAGLLGWGIGWLAGLIRHKGWSVGAAVAGALLVGSLLDILGSFAIMGMLPALSDQNYGVAFAAVGQSLVAVPFTTLAAIIVAIRHHRRVVAAVGAPPAGSRAGSAQ